MLRKQFSVFLLFPGLLLSGCGSVPANQARMAGGVAPSVDLTGSWELDYGKSDNTQQRLDVLVRELRSEMERRNQSGMGQGPVGSGLVISGSGVNSGSSVMGLVRFTDLITQTPLLEIEQDQQHIRIRREDDADLLCEFFAAESEVIETPFGSQWCGWREHQLVFRLALPGGLRIQHIMTAGQNGQKLNVATTVLTDQVTQAFTLNRVYNRFVPGASGFHCEMTLTRGRVCSTRSL
ncbi:MAG: hypothetical protein HRT77_14275 [Halioglobus sp.]|nr:hypothetical protein [Halioglobus sp.]